MPTINTQYNVAKPDSIPIRLATRMRRVMYESFIRLQGPDASSTLLDVGATSDESYEASNYLESWYPYKSNITACGIDDASFLESKYPGMQYVKCDGRELPFPDESFDIVHSSAVLEHVGSCEQQVQFVRELVRVARCGVFFTTPNRWYPIEFHTVLPLLHWLPAKMFRASLRVLGHDLLAREENLNLLSTGDVRKICHELGAIAQPVIETPRLFGWPSNIVCSLRLAKS